MGISKNYDIDIIIPTRNRGDLIALTIESILQNSYQDFKLWVVDQSDDTQTKTTIQTRFLHDSRVNYLHISTPGSNLARSYGFNLGNAPYVLFTDDDCRVDSQWISEMRQELQQPAIWAVFGRVIEDETFKPQIDANLIPVNTESIKMALKDDPRHKQFNHTRRLNLGFGHGACMGVNRQRVKGIGGFDNLLGAGGRFKSWPERDLGYRILHHKGTITYTPKPIVYHRHWRGWQEVKRTNKNYAYGAGAAIGKYWRCGDKIGAIYLLGEWFFDQGIRQVASGLIKWQSSQKIIIGLNHLIYPWQGLWESRNCPIDKHHIIYQSSAAPSNVKPDVDIINKKNS